ncbi:cytochrome P450 [Lactarius pseudohatsudake]|nr:cytochrome P450 [Lactarius pseudohatsudake]
MSQWAALFPRPRVTRTNLLPSRAPPDGLLVHSIHTIRGRHDIDEPLQPLNPSRRSMVGETLLRTVTTFLVGIVFLVPLSIWFRNLERNSQLRAVPTVGFSNPILSYLSFLRFNFDGFRMLKEGYEKTKPGLFKIATFRTWMVYPTSPNLIEDVRKAPNNVLSRRLPTEEFIQTDYTLDFLDKHNHYLGHVILSKLTRITSATFEDIYEELVLALEDNIPTGKEWVEVPTLDTLQRVICRVTNRVFVGAPLCRNRDYQALNLNFATNVIKFATILRLFPDFLKPLVTRTISNLPSQVRREREFIRPMYEERLARMEDLGDEKWEDGPNDMLMWLMNESKGVERSLEGVARRMLGVNFAAIHATSSVLYRLLANPGYVEPLRREVEAVVAEYGWTTDGVDKLHKIDSFVRETQRLDGLGIVVLVRKALRPFTFSNGITVPAGTYVAAPVGAIHTDEEVYTNPDEFDGFRFARLRESSEGPVASKHQAGVTSPAHLSFGHGRHACPGRFFAVTELKMILARIVTTYDLKLEEGKEIPRDFSIASSVIPREVSVLFRKRQK